MMVTSCHDPVDLLR